MATRKQIVGKSWTKDDSTAHTVTFTALKDGLAVKSGQKFIFDLDKVPANNKLNLALHGAAQKIGDDYSGVKGDVDQAFQNIAAMVEQIYTGAWKGERESEGIRIDDLADAIASVRQIPREKVLDALAAPVDPRTNGESDEEPTEADIKEYEADAAAYEAKIAELRKHPAVQLYMNKKKQERLEAELAAREAAARAAGAVDALAGFTG
jgi:hypothetical protein